jgi:hypothetical protein
MDNAFQILKLEDYKSYLPLDIAAVHFSEPGAMGYHGVLRIITNDKRLYMIQYLYDQWPEEDILRACPIMAEFKDMQWFNNPNPFWKTFYMGFGNHLLAKSELAKKFNFDGMTPPQIYGAWVECVLANL